MKIFKFLCLFIISTTVLAAKLAIVSSPSEADVFIVNQKTGQEKNLGKTPYDVEVSQLSSEVSPDEAFQIKIVKNGYDNFNVIIPQFGSTAININANLTLKNEIKFSQDYDLLVSDLFDALRMTRLKDFINSNKKLDLLIERFPQFSISYEMKGMNFYLQKEFKQALNFYSKAFAVNPKNAEAYRMKLYLEKKFKLGESK